MQTISEERSPANRPPGVIHDILRADDIAALWNTNYSTVGRSIQTEIQARNDQGSYCISEMMLRDKLEDKTGLDAHAYTRLIGGALPDGWNADRIRIVSRLFDITTWQGWLEIEWFNTLIRSDEDASSHAQEPTMEQQVTQPSAFNGAQAPEKNAQAENQLEKLARMANAQPDKFGKLVTDTLKAWGHKVNRIADEFRKEGLLPCEMKYLMPWLQNQERPSWSAKHMDAILEVLDDIPENLLKEMQGEAVAEQPTAPSNPAPGEKPAAASVQPAEPNSVSLLHRANENRKAFGAMLTTFLEDRQKRKTDLHRVLLDAGATGKSEQNTYNLLNGSAPWTDQKIAVTVKFFQLSKSKMLEAFEAYLASNAAEETSAPETETKQEPIMVPQTPAAPSVPQEASAAVQAAAEPEPEAASAPAETAAEALPIEPVNEDALTEEAVAETVTAETAVAETQPEPAVLTAETLEGQSEQLLSQTVTPAALETAAASELVTEVTLTDKPADLPRTYRFRPEEQGMVALTAERLEDMPEPERREALEMLVTELKIPDRMVSHFLWQLLQAHAAALPEGSVARLRALHSAMGKTLA